MRIKHKPRLLFFYRRPRTINIYLFKGGSFLAGPVVKPKTIWYLSDSPKGSLCQHMLVKSYHGPERLIQYTLKLTSFHPDQIMRPLFYLIKWLGQFKIIS